MPTDAIPSEETIGVAWWERSILIFVAAAAVTVAPSPQTTRPLPRNNNRLPSHNALLAVSAPPCLIHAASTRNKTGLFWPPGSGRGGGAWNAVRTDAHARFGRFMGRFLAVVECLYRKDDA
ncbi:hypothetical protein Ct61P_14762 [Colletotrichum tofieldiae]|nr:hypothetical protein Ct61P_14762 [Colletotrichum tofieldiae]